jgi:hypothetical protein
MVLHFAKSIFGVQKNSSNYGVMSEVDRLPIILDCFKATIGYWHRLENISSGLLKDAYLDSKKITCSLSNMFNVLKTPGGNTYKSCPISSLKHTEKTELKYMYICTWYNLRNHLINENGKLRTSRMYRNILNL